MNSAMPAVGTKSKCSRCGKTVWLRHTATNGRYNSSHPSALVYEWVARKGTKPRPILCPISDGWPRTYHTVDGYEDHYYGGEDA